MQVFITERALAFAYVFIWSSGANRLDTSSSLPLRKVSAKTASGLYRPELDALRFVAFLGVFLTHGIRINRKAGVLHAHPAMAHAVSNVLRLGGFGLSLFFLLSSFLITTLLLLERENAGKISLRSFYARRALRIWPLYVAFTGLMFIVGLLWHPGYILPIALGSFWLMAGNWYQAFNFPVPITIAFLWSISVEEQFYLVWPLAVRKMSRAGIFLFCGSLLIVTAISGARGASFHDLWFNTGVEMMFFAGGGLLALRLGLKEQKKSAWKASYGMLGSFVCLLLADLAMGPSNDMFTTPIGAPRSLAIYVLGLVAVSSLLWSFLYLPSRLIHPRWVYLGKISYGLYVFHGVVLLVGETSIGRRVHGGAWLLLAACSTVAAAVFSYEYFEKPFLRLKHRFEVIHSRATEKAVDQAAIRTPMVFTQALASEAPPLPTNTLDTHELPIPNRKTLPSRDTPSTRLES